MVAIKKPFACFVFAMMVRTPATRAKIKKKSMTTPTAVKIAATTVAISSAVPGMFVLMVPSLMALMMICLFGSEPKKKKTPLKIANNKASKKALTIPMMKKTLETLQRKDYPAFVKALVSIELGVEDEDKLDELYYKYMKDDRWYLLDDKFYSET